ncbi:MAG TPA: glycine cleavage T C-terminal barrel domain-containing protein [Ignavibacteriaceae bacterium]|nr:glycine cleavage T C-terminal barrel domain-containing protein [Ignavibacteriaceae bacterium]
MIDSTANSGIIEENITQIPNGSNNSNGGSIKNNDSINSELNSLYKGVGLRDISNYGAIELRGNDVLEFLHRISTNSIKDLPKEKIIQTIFTTEKGRIIDKTSLFNFLEFQLLVCSAEQQEKVMRWINKYIISDDIIQTDISGKYTIFELLGPQVESFVIMISGNAVNSIQEDSFKVINTDGIIFFLAKLKDRNGKMKFWIIADPNYGQQLVRYMMENKSIFDFNLIGDEASDIYRIEQGIPSAPYEINDLYNPHEARLMDLVDTKKGCYIGQEVIARLDTYDKVQKYLMGIEFDQTVEEDLKFSLLDSEGVEAGEITSYAYSPNLKKQIGLAYIRKAFIQEGKILAAKSGNGLNVNVLVHGLPFKK